MSRNALEDLWKTMFRVGTTYLTQEVKRKYPEVQAHYHEQKIWRQKFLLCLQC